MKYCVAAFFALISAHVHAAPLSFEFNLGYPTGGAIATSYPLIIGITVDDGGLGSSNRTFLTSDVIGLSATSGTFSIASTGETSIGTVGPASSIITTNGSGVATLGLITGGTFSAVYFEPNSYTSISLANGNNTTVGVLYSGTTTSAFVSGMLNIEEVDTGTSTSEVPLPAGGLLLGTALALLGFTRHRKA